ncbi:MAG: class I SAM-dependent methyltransferase [Flavobacteriales bacterium]
MNKFKRKIASILKRRRTPPQELAKGDYLEVRKMRWDFLIETIKKQKIRTGMEIGAGYGLTAFMVLANTKIDKWTVIDPFQVYDQYEDRMNQSAEMKDMRANTFQLLDPFIQEGRCEIIEEFSEDVDPFSVDMIFIDGNHTYEFVKRDIEKFHPYALEFLGGHDINRPDTAKAIFEKAAEKGLKVEQPRIDDVWYYKS